MALHWENPASTTHSLTPRLQNRPLIFEILTPREKPVATGSAGRCELGVGRFTDPHPLTCSFFTPYLHCLMFRQYSLPQPSPIQPLSGVKFRFSSGPSRASLRCLCRPAWVSFFFFCLSPVSLSHLFLSGDETSFLSPRVGRCSPIRSQLGHTPPTGPVWGFAGVVSLAGPPKPHTGPHRAKFGFPPQKTNSPLPPKGGGAGYRLFGLSGFSPREARCFSAGKGGYFVSEGFSRQLPVATAGHNCPTRLQQGRCGASMVLFSYPAL